MFFENSLDDEETLLEPAEVRAADRAELGFPYSMLNCSTGTVGYCANVVKECCKSMRALAGASGLYF